MLFHATRELLFNVVKHAGVSAAELRLSSDTNELRIVVADDGVGFDLTRQPLQSTAAGFGLFSIRERITQLGGRLEIDTAPGQGTRVALIVPATASRPDSNVERRSEMREQSTPSDG